MEAASHPDEHPLHAGIPATREEAVLQARARPYACRAARKTIDRYTWADAERQIRTLLEVGMSVGELTSFAVAADRVHSEIVRSYRRDRHRSARDAALAAHQYALQLAVLSDLTGHPRHRTENIRRSVG